VTYDIDVGALTPPLQLTATDTSAISVAGGVVLRILDEAGNVVITDNAPTVDASNPLAVKVTHTWLLGQTDIAGTYGAQAIISGVSYPPAPASFTIGAGAATRYCTIQQARDVGATGTDAEVGDAIAAARQLIDRYCSDSFAPTPMTLVATVGGDGTALLPRRVRQVTRVAAVGSPNALATTAYTVLSSRMFGQVDAVILGGGGSYGDPIVAGAEPWNGGWANLIGRFATGQIEVTGVFGWDAPPMPVTAACALLAARITSGALEVGGPLPDTDEEGNVIKVTAGSTPPVASSRTTGDAGADALLFGHRNARLRLTGV
jgi:hypothetical protein